MNQADLYNAITKAGYVVLEFSDHPGFFGSWYVIVKRKRSIFLISEDGRECWLTLGKKNLSNEWVTLRDVNCGSFDEQETIPESARWLTSIEEGFDSQDREE
jgi:hypothetical protein